MKAPGARSTSTSAGCATWRAGTSTSSARRTGWAGRRGSMPGMSGMAAPGKADLPASAKGEETVEVTLTPEAIERAGIRIADVRSGAALSGITVPGTVMSNAYRDTKVNALVGGIVRQVS